MTPKLSPVQKAWNKAARAYAEWATYDGEDRVQAARLAQRFADLVDAAFYLEEPEHAHEDGPPV